MNKNLNLQSFPSLYSNEYNLLVNYGKLKFEEGWGNVVEHSLKVAQVTEILCELLRISEDDKYRIIKAALCHDWDKRLDLKPNDFSIEDRSKAEKIVKEIEIDESLLFATKPDFIEEALLKNNSIFLQRLIYFIDASTMGSHFVHFIERISDAKARDTNPGGSNRVRDSLGDKYWDNELELASRVAEEILIKLTENGVDIKSSKDIPQLINIKLQVKYQ